MRRYPILLTALVVLCIGCAGAGWEAEEMKRLRENPRPTEVKRTVEDFRKWYPDSKVYFEEAYAYAVFPEVTKAGAGIGGAYGEGYVYVDEELVGLTTLSKGSLGVQLGAETASEIIFFKDEETLKAFKRGNFVLGAQASAVATDEGAGARTSYSKGVAVFVLTREGLMFDASVAGQQFTYTSIKP